MLWVNGRNKCARAANNTIYGMPVSVMWAHHRRIRQTPCFIGSKPQRMSVLPILFEVIGGEGVGIYSGDTAKTDHLPFKKIPEPGGVWTAKVTLRL